ncbi:U11/U12 small nuclear ribonucleoprotein 48 kDa protein [Ambystoma mexicanum]|uniref:U11/U12 small nuclear ribonucleoprotein 48 kDa protein n=1 Tax=Ambystoma mexicanum TaxID=8296 RepID=UPI0037E741BD
MESDISLPAAAPPLPLPATQPPLPDGAERREQLRRELSALADACDQELVGVMAALQWKPGAGARQGGTALCPYDQNHRMPKSSLEKHLATCKLRKLGYSKEEVDLCDPSFFYDNTRASTFVLEKDCQSRIIKQARENAQNGKDGAYSSGAYSLQPPEVPQNHKHAICDLTQADRLAIYDYVLEETKKQRSRAQASAVDSDLFEDLTAKVNQDAGQKEPKSHLEVLAELRDYKRRRQSYRAKNVHITKKSYTEVIRDVISVHMEELVHHWQEEEEPDDGGMHETASCSNSVKSVIRIEGKRSGSVDSVRSDSVDSRHSGPAHRDIDHSRHRRDRSSSPHKKRSRENGRDSRKRKEREEERHHSQKRRK